MCEETTMLLSKIFSEQSSLFNTRWPMPKSCKKKKKEYEGYTTSASIVNREC